MIIVSNPTLVRLSCVRHGNCAFGFRKHNLSLETVPQFTGIHMASLWAKKFNISPFIIGVGAKNGQGIKI